MLTRTIPVLLSLSLPALAQANATPGLDGWLYDIGSPTVWGRQGPAWPNGELGFSASNTMCNPGTVDIPWFQAMAEDHPMFGFLVTRLLDDRMVQISDRSHCKHAFLSINSNQGPCAPCQNPGTGSLMGIGCSDVYSAGNNANRYWLGPADEIDPWLGTWTAVGSYFDRGDPDVGPPQNMDGVRSLTTAMTSTSAMGPVRNRVTIQEQDLVAPNAQFFYQVHLVHRGEPVANRGNNLLSRGVSFGWNGASWTAANAAPARQGPVLERWPGATVSLGGNGADDGRFAVAVKVTGPTDGLWHYEYAVQDIDNARGAASFRLPICDAARVVNLGFRDIDGDALNQWTATVGNGELVWSAPASNALRWNMLFNFWFDSDAAPTAGDATLDQALVGPGALSVTVPTQVPGTVPNVYLGDGCGSPSVQLYANGEATIPNPGFALQVQAAPFTGLLFFYALQGANLPLGPGCTQFLDSSSIGTGGFFLTGITGDLQVPLAIPAGVGPITVYFQAAGVAPGGPVLGNFALSNGLAVRVGLSGCP